MRRMPEQRDADDVSAAISVLAGRVFVFGGYACALMPLICGVPDCKRFAVLTDAFAPFMAEQNRCATHAAEASPRGK